MSLIDIFKFWERWKDVIKQGLALPKTIGILGGMGSFATLHFFKTLLELSEPDEFRIVLDNAVHILERTKAVKEHREGEVAQDIIKSFYHLSRMKADFVVVPCNQAHHWYDRVADMFDMPWLNMIKIVSDTITEKGYSRPLILGGYVTVTKKLYSEYLPGAVYPQPEQQESVLEMIRYAKKNGGSIIGISEQGRLGLCRIDERGRDCVVLACTELSIFFPHNYPETLNGLPIIDSSLELAKAAIKYARGE